MRILVTPTFERTVKKLHGQQKADVDAAVKAVASDISIGEEKWVILLGPACTNFAWSISCAYFLIGYLVLAASKF